MPFGISFDSLLAPKSQPSTRRLSRVVNRRSSARRLLLEGLEDRRLLAFLPVLSYSVDPSPQAVVSGDFNGDGRLDLATANSGSSNLSVLLGNADGSFQPALNAPSGAGQLSLAAGDFNGDGKLDLATANANDISVLLGNGNGTFQVPTPINIGSSPSSVAVGDFNADGKLDLGVTSGRYYYGGYYGGGSSVGGASVLLGNGDGSFAAASTTPFGDGGHLGAVVEDFNGDGRDDFAVANWDSGSIELQLANANGSLGAITNLDLGYLYPSSIAGGDIDGDGRFDLVATGGGNVSVLLGNADGTFQPPRNSESDWRPRSMAIADFNGDGKLDLVMDSGYATVSVRLGDGAANFVTPVSVATGTGPLGLAVGDFNADGRTDVASAHAESNEVSLLLNDGIWPSLNVPFMTINNATVAEGNTGATVVTFTVALSAPSGQTVSVHYATADGTATLAGDDYQAASGNLSFAPGETTQSITVLVNGDRSAEYDEIFYVQLSSPTNALITDATGAGAIVNDDPRFSIDEYASGDEGNAGTTPLTFNVTLSAAQNTPVTVNYATADLTSDWIASGYPLATAGVDYVATSGTLTFAAGETNQTITVLVNGDQIGESTEYFLVNLIDAEVYNHQALAVIIDDEPFVHMSYDSDSAVVEGNTGTTPMVFTVFLSAASEIPVTVDYFTSDGSASASNDYHAAAGTVTFAAGETSQTFTVQVVGDTQLENDEYFTVNLTNATHASIGDGFKFGYILNDDAAATISINDASIVEGNTGTRLLTFTVSLSTASIAGVWVNYATANGTATTSNNDYTATSGSLYFAPGETSKTISISIKGDTKKEKDERFYLNLSNAIGGDITDARGVGTILNDDGTTRNKKLSSVRAVDAAIDDLMGTKKGKRRR